MLYKVTFQYIALLYSLRAVIFSVPKECCLLLSNIMITQFSVFRMNSLINQITLISIVSFTCFYSSLVLCSLFLVNLVKICPNCRDMHLRPLLSITQHSKKLGDDRFGSCLTLFPSCQCLRTAEEEVEKMAAIAEQEKLKNINMEKQLQASAPSSTFTSVPSPVQDLQQALLQKDK